MDYTLAAELKNAGFPQGLLPNCFPEDWFEKDQVFKKSKEVAVYAPTLEELVEECGDISIALGKYSEGCYPEGKKCYAWYGPAHGSGMTLTEAVARLWLALNPRHVAASK